MKWFGWGGVERDETKMQDYNTLWLFQCWAYGVLLEHIEYIRLNISLFAPGNSEEHYTVI